MKKDIQVLKTKKEGLISRLFGLRKKVEEEIDQREHKTEIVSLETEIRSVDQQIFDSLTDEARTRVDELSTEAVGLVEEKKGLQKRTEEIEKNLIEIFTLISALIPKQRYQISSRRTVKMIREVEEREFSGFFASAWDARSEGSIYTKTKKVLEIDCPAFPSQISHARSLGYEIKAGEKVEEEILTDKNSILVNVFPMPEIFQ